MTRLWSLLYFLGSFSLHLDTLILPCTTTIQGSGPSQLSLHYFFYASFWVSMMLFEGGFMYYDDLVMRGSPVEF